MELTGSKKYGPYKITAGVYYDEHFWESYAEGALQLAREHLGETI